MQHLIFICTLQDKRLIDNIVKSITDIGIKVVPHSNGGDFYTDSEATTTVVAIRVSGWESTNYDLRKRVDEAISKYGYLGLVTQEWYGNSSWNAGNAVVSVGKKINSISKSKEVIFGAFLSYPLYSLFDYVRTLG